MMEGRSRVETTAGHTCPLLETIHEGPSGTDRSRHTVASFPNKGVPSETANISAIAASARISSFPHFDPMCLLSILAGKAEEEAQIC